MANVTITQLPAAGAITGSELVPIVQDGQTVRTTASALAGSPVQTQTFITVNQEPTLANSRALAGGTGVGLVDGGAQSTLQISLTGASGSLEGASNGVIVKTASSTVTSRSIAVSGTGLSIANGSGVSGNPTVSLSGLISAISALGGNGLLAFQGGSTAGGVLIAGTTNQISVANGDGSTGNPTISLPTDVQFPGTDAVTVPIGTTAQRPAGVNGMIRYNSTSNNFEVYANSAWSAILSGFPVRTTVLPDATSVTFDVSTTDIAVQNNTQAVGTLTVNAPVGTPFNGQRIIFRLQSTNVQTFSWNAAFVGSSDLALPVASSGGGLYDYVGFIYNSSSSNWQLIAKVFGF